MQEKGKKWMVSEIYEPKKLSINELALEDRPREKLMAQGASALSKAELLAILIGSGTKKKTAIELMQEVLNECDGSLKTLGKMSIDELMQYNGIGEAKAITILAACELGKRREHEDAERIINMSSADIIYEYMLPKVKDLTTEQAWILLLNNNMRLLKAKCLSEGGYTETAVDVRMIIREAVLANATVVALVHNHPSGNTNPSRNDDAVTKQVDDACKIMRLHFADHIIVTDGNYFSYHDNGKL